MNGYYKQIIKELQARGFKRCHGGKGSHEKWELGSISLIVPFKCLSRHTANSIMKDAGSTKRF